MSRVIVLEPQRLDVSPATVYGSLCILFPEDGTRASVWENQFQVDFLRRLEEIEFNPDDDYLVNVGAAVPLAIAIAEVVRTYGRIKLLLWNASARTYVPRLIPGDYDVYYDGRGLHRDSEDLREGNVTPHRC